MDHDVVIIGGGPGGSTTGALLRKYDPALRVLIVERERFPREHVGESQLPPIGAILDEMGCWDEVEAANFPIKIGVTFRWGASDALWDFEFLPLSEFADQPRPAKYEGQRKRTALQVDRAVYDKILLDHAGKLGCEVREQTGVVSVEREGDRVTGLVLDNGERINARWYVDASGHTGILRRAMGVAVDCPTQLKNVATWRYWDDARWADEIGVGGTRVQVLSLGFGWVWFIPVSPTRASVGLVCPAAHLRASGKSLAELYDQALATEPRVRELMTSARAAGPLRSTKDWSFLAERATGSNWMLVGESIGFADPVLAAGMTLTQTGAREAAYTLLALVSAQHDAAWLLDSYDRNQRARIRQHIRFADFWYASNGQFSDLQDHCREIAKEAGLELDAQQAWRWLAQGGFTNDTLDQAGIGGLSLAGVKGVGQRVANLEPSWEISRYSSFTLNLDGAENIRRPLYRDGRIHAIEVLSRDGRELPVSNFYSLLLQVIPRAPQVDRLIPAVQQVIQKQLGAQAQVGMHHCLEALEVMVSEGWVRGKTEPGGPRLNIATPRESRLIHSHEGS